LAQSFLIVRPEEEKTSDKGKSGRTQNGTTMDRSPIHEQKSDEKSACSGNPDPTDTPSDTPLRRLPHSGQELVPRAVD
jgi:hypothetical protein